MIQLTEDIQPLTTFRNNSVKMMQQLKKTQRPVVLTVNGKAEAVIQDVAAYQRLLDLAALANAAEGVRQGEADLRGGRTRPARVAFKALRKRHDVSD